MGSVPLKLCLVVLPFLAMGCKEKVDCDKMQSRLTACMHDTYARLNKEGRDLKNPRFKKDDNEITAKYVKLIDDNYYQKCKAIGGKEKRAKKINKCLSEKSCELVHACLKEVLQ